VLILLSLLLRAGTNDAEAPQQALPTMVTASAIHRMKPEDAARGYPVRLQAVVTYYDPAPNPRHTVLFVSDKSGSIYVALSRNPVASLKPADWVEITGVTGPGEFAPVVDFAQARRIGTGQLPAAAPRVDLADMAIGEVDGQWVEIEGVVHSIRTSGKHLYVDIALRDGDITAMTLNENRAYYEPLIDATVRVRGNEGTIFNDRRQLTGAHLLFPGRQTLRVVTPAPAKAFDLPLKRIDGLLRYSTSAALHHREHVRGIVTLDWPGRLLCIADETQGLCAQIEQTELLHRGDRVDVAGFPQVGAFTPTMSHAIFRESGAFQKGRPMSVIPDQALSGRSDAELVTIEGRLIGHDLSAADPTPRRRGGKICIPGGASPQVCCRGSQIRRGQPAANYGGLFESVRWLQGGQRIGFPHRHVVSRSAGISARHHHSRTAFVVECPAHAWRSCHRAAGCAGRIDRRDDAQSKGETAKRHDSRE
jgi:hypothetical protein